MKTRHFKIISNFYNLTKCYKLLQLIAYIGRHHVVCITFFCHQVLLNTVLIGRYGSIPGSKSCLLILSGYEAYSTVNSNFLHKLSNFY